MKPYQWAILIGGLAAALQDFERFKGWQTAASSLEAPAFLICTAGIVGGSRPLRLRFEKLGSDNGLALNDPSYMSERYSFQVWACIAVSVITSLLAVRMNWSPLIALPVSILLFLALPTFNRATGWVKSSL